MVFGTLDTQESKPGPFRRFRAAIAHYKQELRAPLPNTEHLSRFGKVRARVRYLFKRFGWKMFWGIFIFYLIRDVVLYILIPYLVAKQIIG